MRRASVGGGLLAAIATLTASGQEVAVQTRLLDTPDAEPPVEASFSLRPDVTCESGVCNIRLKAYAEGTTVVTDDTLAYPYDVLVDTEPYEPRPMATTQLADRLPGAYGYVFGREERTTEVFIEPLASLGRLNVFAVEQRAGYEEVRQAHYLFWIGDARVTPILQRVDGPGPVYSSLKLAEDRVVYERRFYPEDELGHMDTYEAFVWIFENGVETLVPASGG